MLRQTIGAPAGGQAARSRGALGWDHLPSGNLDDREVRKLGRIQITQIRSGHANLRGAHRDRFDDQAAVTLIQLRENIIQEQHWRLTSTTLQQIHLGQLGGDQCQPLLPARTKSTQVNTVDSKDEIVTVRTHRSHPTSQFLRSRIAQSTRELSGYRLLNSGHLRFIVRPASWQAVDCRQAMRLVSNLERLDPCQAREMLACEGVQAGDVNGPFGEHDCRGRDEFTVPERELLGGSSHRRAACLTCQRAQETVSLLENAREPGESSQIRATCLADGKIEEAPSAAGGAGEKLNVVW
ncbi:MAG: hypothetical protein U0Z70_09150 [Thermomicrobiales bacterium]